MIEAAPSDQVTAAATQESRMLRPDGRLQLVSIGQRTLGQHHPRSYRCLCPHCGRMFDAYVGTILPREIAVFPVCGCNWIEDIRLTGFVEWPASSGWRAIDKPPPESPSFPAWWQSEGLS